MRLLGILLILVASATPLYWFWPMATQHGFFAVMSQYIGVVALILMCFTQLLTTRFVVLEHVFGGLDRMYVLHKWLGIVALSAVLLHDTIDADVEGLGRETGLTELADTFGEFSLYGFLVLGMITIVTFIPYHWWKLTHKFMGALFALAAFHYAFIIKPFDLFDPVGIYINTFCIAGIVFYLFTLLPNAIWRGRHSYIVENVEQSGDATSVTLKPKGRGLSHAAGQFAFVNFKTNGHNEVHPFTISSAPNSDREIRFSFKQLGDGTRKLANSLEVGTKAKLSPAYGHFRRNSKNITPEVWIAGGIGITPFLAFAGDLKPSDTPIHLFYCVGKKAQAAHLEELYAAAAANPNFNLHLIESRKDGRISADMIKKRIGSPIEKCKVYFCGAEKMRTSLAAQFRANGLPSRNFKFEEFEIRQGIVSTQTARKIFGWTVGMVGMVLARRMRG